MTFDLRRNGCNPLPAKVPGDRVTALNLLEREVSGRMSGAGTPRVLVSPAAAIHPEGDALLHVSFESGLGGQSP